MFFIGTTLKTMRNAIPIELELNNKHLNARRHVGYRKEGQNILRKTSISDYFRHGASMSTVPLCRMNYQAKVLFHLHHCIVGSVC